MVTKAVKEKERGFLEVAAELLAAQGKKCVVCTHKDVKNINQLKIDGASAQFIADVLQKIGVYHEVSRHTAADRVLRHFNTPSCDHSLPEPEIDDE